MLLCSLCALLFLVPFCFFFFFNDTATTEIYTLSLHDALPICLVRRPVLAPVADRARGAGVRHLDQPFDRHCVGVDPRDRKSTRLNSSHSQISYAVFCLKKKKKLPATQPPTALPHTKHWSD